MKKILLLLVLSTTILKMVGQPVITNLYYPSTVGLFGLYEISFEMGLYSNPYDPDTISAYAIFYSPNNTTIEVPAFYYEDYSFQIVNGYETTLDSLTDVGWRIRFTPTCTGSWSFRIVAKDQDGTTLMPSFKSRPYYFTCTSVNSADGFIGKANSRYLKRSVVINGGIYERSFFPIGPNIAWYSCKDYGTWKQPRGIYDYERYIDSLDGNGNYMRIWLNRYQYLNLYGPEYTQNPTVYFDSLLNQKNAAELDHIVAYAAQHDVALMMCIFSYGDFRTTNTHEQADPSVWGNNPFNTLLSPPCYFFSNADAARVSKNLIRYIISRWGYATNVMCWELWNEVSHIDPGYLPFDQEVLEWHEEMSDFIRSTDPFHHCISTSTGGFNENNIPILYLKIFENMDIAQQHKYLNIQKAKSKEQTSYVLYLKSLNSLTDYPTMPFFMGEFGFGQEKGPKYSEKDPYGIDLHNTLWSSMFSSSMGPGSFWYWHYIDTLGLFNRFNPILTFCNGLPVLSGSFRPYTTGTVNSNNRTLDFPNSLETYYMKNAAEDTIYGWSQDTAFCYQSLRWLTDSVRLVSDTTGDAWHFVDSAIFDPLGYVYTLDPLKKPGASSNSNTINIRIYNHAVGTQYRVSWYNSETGYAYPNTSPNVAVYQKPDGTRWIDLEFPSFIRNVQNHTISNTFGDAVFRLTKKGLDQ